MKKPVKPTPVTQRIKIITSEDISREMNGTPAAVIEYLRQYDQPGYRIEFISSWDSGEVRLYREDVEPQEEYLVRLKEYELAMKKYEEDLKAWKIEKAKETLEKLQATSKPVTICTMETSQILSKPVSNRAVEQLIDMGYDEDIGGK